MNGPNTPDPTRAPNVGDTMVVSRWDYGKTEILKATVVKITPSGLIDVEMIHILDDGRIQSSVKRFKAWKDRWSGSQTAIVHPHGRRTFGPAYSLRWPRPGELSAFDDSANAARLRRRIAASMGGDASSLDTLRQIVALLGLEGE